MASITVRAALESQTVRGPDFGIGEMDALAPDPVPFEGDHFAKSASGQHEQADDGDDMRAPELVAGEHGVEPGHFLGRKEPFPGLHPVALRVLAGIGVVRPVAPKLGHGGEPVLDVFDGDGVHGGDLQVAMTRLIDDLVDGCQVVPDEDDVDGQTLFVEYPTLYPSGDIAYVAPRVRIEAGARSALDLSLNCTITPYVAVELPDWSFDVGEIKVIAPERTYWEKLLILHGVHCGYRDAERLPADRDRISRHYYDVAMITATETGRSALSDMDLLDAVRNHNLTAFRQAWKRFEEAIPGSVRLVPQPDLRTVIERDYGAMQGMILGDVPDFGWVMEQLQYAEAAINGT